jgi:hypothetical protein
MGRSTNRNLRNRRRLQKIGKKLRRLGKEKAKAARSAPKTA